MVLPLIFHHLQIVMKLTWWGKRDTRSPVGMRRGISKLSEQPLVTELDVVFPKELPLPVQLLHQILRLPVPLVSQNATSILDRHHTAGN